VVTALGLCGLVIALSSASAHGQSASPCTIRIADDTPTRGSIQMVIGEHFPTTPRTVPIEVNGAGQVGLASIDDGGHFADPVRVPADLAQGLHTLSVNCGTDGAPAITEVNVVSADAPANHAEDDDDTPGIVVAGVIAIVLALTLTTRRRRLQRIAT
jgi:hypothetical protein